MKSHLLSSFRTWVHLILFFSFFVVIGCQSDNTNEPASNLENDIPVDCQTRVINVFGKMRYEDREYNADGFTGTPSYYKAVRYAKIEAVDSATNAILSEGFTNADGDYSLPICSDKFPLYIRLSSLTGVQNKPMVEVDNTSALLYSLAGPDIALPSGDDATTDIDIPMTNPVAGAFNIFDTLTAAGEFVRSLVGINPELIKAYWQVGSGGTYYCRSNCPQTEGIYILGGDSLGYGDTDEYDDDVLWHEYGHFIANKFSRDDSPGGAHSISENNLDLRLTWSEGWASFFSSAVKEWLSNNALPTLSTTTDTAATLYVDTVDSLTSISFDIATPNSIEIYAGNEIAVAHVLLKTGELFLLSDLWEVFNFYLPASVYPVSLEVFWDGWLNRINPTEEDKIILRDIYQEREIYYVTDIFENDASAAFASVITSGVPQYHTLYAGDGLSEDSDTIAFAATANYSYTITTSGLTNGADTYLTLINTDSASDLDLQGRDDFLSSLASQIAFTATETATYNVVISVSPYRLPSSGKYGNYTVTVTSP